MREFEIQVLYAILHCQQYIQGTTPHENWSGYNLYEMYDADIGDEGNALFGVEWAGKERNGTFGKICNALGKLRKEGFLHSTPVSHRSCSGWTLTEQGFHAALIYAKHQSSLLDSPTY